MRPVGPALPDRILIPGIPLQARVGCTPEERAVAQRVLLDLELECDAHAAGEADDLALAVDYVGVRDTVERVATARPFRLIEALAESVASEILRGFPVPRVRVRVRKPAALADFGVPWAGVEIERHRRG